MTVDEILALDSWVERGATVDEREERVEQVRDLVFPPGLSADEVVRRQQIVEEARSKKEAESTHAEDETLARLIPRPEGTSDPTLEENQSPKDKRPWLSVNPVQFEPIYKPKSGNVLCPITRGWLRESYQEIEALKEETHRSPFEVATEEREQEEEAERKRRAALRKTRD